MVSRSRPTRRFRLAGRAGSRSRTWRTISNAFSAWNGGRVAGEASGVSAQAAALDQLHGEVVLPLVFADVVDGDDVRMIEATALLGFDAEASDLFGRGELAGEDHLEGDDAVQRLVLGL